MNGSLYITNPDGVNLAPRGCLQGFWIIIVAVLVTVALCLISPGCKSVKVVEQTNVKDSTVYTYRDSVIYHYRDSIRLVEQKVLVNDSASLVIQFGQGGGTYNSKTGEATNVTGVQQTDTHSEQRDSTAYYRNRYFDEVSYNEFLSQRCIDYNNQLTEERKKSRTGYDRFCSWWFWITALLLLAKIACWVMEKIPTTAPYVTMIRRFVPFL